MQKVPLHLWSNSESGLPWKEGSTILFYSNIKFPVSILAFPQYLDAHNDLATNQKA